MITLYSCWVQLILAVSFHCPVLLSDCSAVSGSLVSILAAEAGVREALLV